MLYREIIDVCSQIHTKHINTLCGQNVKFVNVNIQSVLSVNALRLGYKNQSMYGEIMAVCSEIHTKHINTTCGQN